MLLNGAANRDPGRFECPAEFRVDRPNAEAHIAFGRGAHSCPGGPLARAEAPGQPRAHPRPDARHPALRGAPRSAGRPPLRLRADVDPPRPHQAAPRVHADRRRASEPGRGRHRRGLGHRARRRPRASSPTATTWPSSTATVRGAEAAADELAAAGRQGRSRSRSTSPTGPSVDAGFARVRAELGPVEILVTSAGIESFDALLDITAEIWDRIIAVNLTGTFTVRPGRGARHARRRLGPHRHHLVVERPVGGAEHGALRGVEGRRHLA